MKIDRARYVAGESANDRPIMEKVKKIEDVFSENNKANYFSSVLKRLSDVEN